MKHLCAITIEQIAKWAIQLANIVISVYQAITKKS